MLRCLPQTTGTTHAQEHGQTPISETHITPPRASTHTHTRIKRQTVRWRMCCLTSFLSLHHLSGWLPQSLYHLTCLLTLSCIWLTSFLTTLSCIYLARARAGEGYILYFFTISQIFTGLSIQGEHLIKWWRAKKERKVETEREQQTHTHAHTPYSLTLSLSSARSLVRTLSARDLNKASKLTFVKLFVFSMGYI